VEIALISESDRLNPVELAFQAAALDAQMRLHFAPAWGLEPWPVSAYAKLPTEHASLYHPMFVMDEIGAPDALGFHDDAAQFIYSRVLAPSDASDATTASHEACEERGDPTCDLWRPMPDGRLVALEASDAVETTDYPITVTLNGETRTIRVSNFCLPDWWKAGSSGPWDYLGLLRGPFQLLPGGYMIVQHQDGRTENVYADRAVGKLLAFKRADPMSRTSRRHAKASAARTASR